jgi:hypothetical protein
MQLFKRFFGQTTNGPTALYRRYCDAIDLTGQNLMFLPGSSREEAQRLFPMLAAPQSMERRRMNSAEVTVSGETADEVHEFENARQGADLRIIRLLLREGRVIQLTCGNLAREYPSCALPV